MPFPLCVKYELESRIQRTLGGISGGLKRLTSVAGVVSSNSDESSKPKREEPKVNYSRMPRAVVELATLNHISIVKEVVEQHYRNRSQTDEHMLKYMEEQWLATEASLTQERGLWGPFNENPLTKWQVDLTEGPSRMRKRLVRNDLFYLLYPHREDKSGGDAAGEAGDSGTALHKPHKYRRPMSRDSRMWFKQHRHQLSMFEREQKVVEELDYDDCDITVNGNNKSLTIDEQMRKIGFQGIKSALVKASTLDEESPSEEDNKEVNEESLSSDQDNQLESGSGGGGSVESTPAPTEPTSPTTMAAAAATTLPVVEEDSSDYQMVMQLLEEGEKITHMYRCARIQGLDTFEGLLLFGREHFYILDGFTLVNGREVHDIDFLPPGRFDPIIPEVPGQGPTGSQLLRKRQVNKFACDNIKEVQKRRYLLQPIAVEIFCTDGQNHLLAFTKTVRAKAYQRFLTTATSISDSAQMSVAGQRRSANVEQGSGILSSLMGETSVTQRWVRGEVSNFQYLMALNTLAGRSYNDLMQYPVFPWILADYTSEELDLTNPKTFRDLSRPMGAQTEQRLKQFTKRFEEWDDPHNETPPYHYGTHYSSAMIVSSYLVRLEPFTQHFLRLQGGHFDLADRMFHSVEEAWESASKNNMADLRELIPEFFYLPDFLSNDNRFDLGMKQNGEELNDVLLPPWAKESPAEFVRVNREALESEYVSAHLHEWIDLIFGWKQQGPAATDAVNVFHYLFYEGNVDIFAIEDPLQRNATIGFINNFGQIPKQLFKKPHPAKRVTPPASVANGDAATAGTSSSLVNMNSKVFFYHLTNLRPSMNPIKELKGPVGQIKCASDRGNVVYAVEQNKVLVPSPGNSNRYLAWGYADQSFRLGNYDSDKAVFICEPNYLIGQVLTCVCPNAKVVLTAGTSSVVAVYEYHKKVKQLLIKKMLYGHTDAVTCLAASPDWSVAVSGSRDRTAIIWDLSRYCYVKHLAGHAGPVAAVTVNELTGDIVTCAGSWLYLWDINGRLQASVNTAATSLTASQPKMMSQHPQQQQILCVCSSEYNEWDRENVVMTGSADGVVRMWSIDYVEVPVGGDQQEDQSAATEDDAVSSSSSDSMATLLAKKMSMSEEAIKTFRETTDKAKIKTEEDPPPKQQQTTTTAAAAAEGFVVVSMEGDSKADSTPPAAKSSSSSSNKSCRDGYTWARRLVFRARLTMHTAFERKDNAEPAAVTALSVSRDHRTVYVGDEKGRVWSWAVSSKPGKGMVDHWCKDEGSESCVGCGVRFTIYERRHHCRACGRLFCSSCSQYQSEIPELKILQKVRVCKPCLGKLEEAKKRTK